MWVEFGKSNHINFLMFFLWFNVLSILYLNMLNFDISRSDCSDSIPNNVFRMKLTRWKMGRCQVGKHVGEGVKDSSSKKKKKKKLINYQSRSSPQIEMDLRSYGFYWGQLEEMFDAKEEATQLLWRTSWCSRAWGTGQCVYGCTCEVALARDDVLGSTGGAHERLAWDGGRL